MNNQRCPRCRGLVCACELYELTHTIPKGSFYSTMPESLRRRIVRPHQEPKRARRQPEPIL